MRRIPPCVARPPRHRRGGGAVLSRVDDRRVGRGTQPAAPRRPAATAASEPGNPPRARRHVGPRWVATDTTCCRPSSAISSPRAVACTHPLPNRSRDCRTRRTRVERRRVAARPRRRDARSPRDPCRPRGNTTFSPEEADTVVELVRDLLGRRWTDASDADEGPPTEARGPALADRPHRRHAVQRAALDRPRRTRSSRLHTSSGRDGRQVPGAGGGGRHHLTRRIVRRGSASGHRVPAAQEPAERRHLTGEMGGVSALLARTPRRLAAQGRGRRAAQRVHPARRCRRAGARHR